MDFDLTTIKIVIAKNCAVSVYQAFTYKLMCIVSFNPITGINIVISILQVRIQVLERVKVS